jgi:hypothetical protein
MGMVFCHHRETQGSRTYAYIGNADPAYLAGNRRGIETKER